MDYVLPVLVVGTICTATFFYKEVIKFTFKCIKTPPGISAFHKERGQYFVQTNLGKLRVNHVKTPALDTEVFFFKKGHEIDLKKNTIMDKKQFEEEFKNYETTQLLKYNFGIITDVYYPKDYKRKNKIVGFINNFLEKEVYLFVFDQNHKYLEIF